jgi:hypothetical protein
MLAVCLVYGLPAWSQQAETAMRAAIFITGSVFFLVPLVIFGWRPSIMTATLTIVVFAVGNRLVSPIPHQYAASDPCKVQPAVYAGIVDGATRLVTIDPIYRRERIWFDEHEIIRPLNDCSISLGLMAYSMRAMSSVDSIAPPFPMPGINDVHEAQIRELVDGDAFLTIITDNAAHLASWDRRLAALGLERQEIAQYRVPVMDGGFTVHAWTIHQ